MYTCHVLYRLIHRARNGSEGGAGADGLLDVAQAAAGADGPENSERDSAPPSVADEEGIDEVVSSDESFSTIGDTSSDAISSSEGISSSDTEDEDYSEEEEESDGSSDHESDDMDDEIDEDDADDDANEGDEEGNDASVEGGGVDGIKAMRGKSQGLTFNF